MVTLAQRSSGGSGSALCDEAREKRARAIRSAENDMHAERRESIFRFKKGSALDKFVSQCLCEENDKELFHMLMNTTVLSVPAAVLVFLLTPQNNVWGHLIGAIYFIVHYATFLQPFILALHYSSHRQLFKTNSGLAWFNKMAPHVLCPLFGIPSGLYYLHHVVMHHCHDNTIPFDISSTELYQRDSIVHFVLYLIKWFTAIYFNVVHFALKRKHYRLFFDSIFQISFYSVGIYLAYRHKPTATLWVLIIPHMFTHFMLCFGNWSQHIFVDNNKPSNFRSTYNCLDCPDNTKSFNDGYHILHHKNSKMHWGVFPKDFVKTVDQMTKEQAFSFVGIGFFDVGFLTLTKRLHVLADKVVTPWDMSKDQLVQLMRDRLGPINKIHRKDCN
mmetsp:Transcript_15123/g.38457  ORF Transcript_15123/g.38457 Transcript_15123/m.38457 type:complete len:387 (+) Transcript_15123:53-1213(+)